ncbi:MAG: hypothetical protein Q7R99_01355 [bacterium]|nr:hypothetical protein [bacterium]
MNTFIHCNRTKIENQAKLSTATKKTALAVIRQKHPLKNFTETLKILLAKHLFPAKFVLII